MARSTWVMAASPGWVERARTRGDLPVPGLDLPLPLHLVPGHHLRVIMDSAVLIKENPMKKLSLDVESLRVESFDATRSDEARGTVVARAPAGVFVRPGSTTSSGS